LRDDLGIKLNGIEFSREIVGELLETDILRARNPEALNK
jgi:hypothetical protein